MQCVGDKLGFPVSKLFFSSGAELESMEFLRDDDVLYTFDQRDQPSQKVTSSSREMPTRHLSQSTGNFRSESFKSGGGPVHHEIINEIEVPPPPSFREDSLTLESPPVKSAQAVCPLSSNMVKSSAPVKAQRSEEVQTALLSHRMAVMG